MCVYITAKKTLPFCANCVHTAVVEFVVEVGNNIWDVGPSACPGVVLLKYTVGMWLQGHIITG